MTSSWSGSANADAQPPGFDEQLCQHPDLRDFLLGTGGRVLVEAPTADAIWGIGLAADDDRASSPADWPGLNLLGFALMEVRHQLRAEAGRTQR